MKKLLSIVAVLLLASTSFAALTEVKKEFLNQTGPVAATVVIPATATAAVSYTVQVTLSYPGTNVGATLRYTDDLNNSIAVTVISGGAHASIVPIRVKSGTSVTIETDADPSSGPYNLAVGGIGYQ